MAEKKTSLSVLNQLVANQGVLYIKLHQYHWFVQGPHFYTLHAKFDEFAERLIIKGEKPYSTLEEYLEHASIKEKRYDEKMSAEEMVSDTVHDFRTIKELALEGIELAGEENDSVTEDMLIGYKESIDQTIWMLQAYLGKDADEK